jgi:hypothetical protein
VLELSRSYERPHLRWADVYRPFLIALIDCRHIKSLRLSGVGHNLRQIPAGGRPS